MKKLTTRALQLLALFFVMLALGAALTIIEAPEPGDGYFLLYALIGVVLSGTALLRRPKAKYTKRVSMFAQIIIVFLMLGMAAAGILAASALALNATRPDGDYISLVLICAVIVVICGVTIIFACRERRRGRR